MKYGQLLDCWMESRFAPGLELIATYIDDVEQECEQSVSQFKASSDGYEESVGTDEAGNDQFQWVTTHKGLADNAWCLPEIFEHSFPTLKRGAALTVLCSYMEHELNELCREVENQLVTSVSVEDMKGQGVVRAVLYLRKMGNVVLDCNNNPHWKKMEQALQLRNVIVHAGGRIERPAVGEIVRKNEFLDCVDDVVDIRSKYLRSVIADFTAVGHFVDAALKARFSSRRKLEKRK